MTATADQWVSLSSADLLISLRAPRGWQVRPADENRIELFAATADEGAYRAGLNVLQGEPEEPGAAWFSAFADAAPRRLAATIEGFELIDTDEFWLSSRARVRAVRFRQAATGAPPTSHLQAYVWAHSYRMYLVNGATLRAHEARDLPVFDGIVGSLRLLPPVG